jgi:ribose 5-phosphate isomerase RpiB
MKAAIGCDHAGVTLKNEILTTGREMGIEWKD